MRQVSTAKNSGDGVIPPMEPSHVELVEPPAVSPYGPSPTPKKSNTVYWVIGSLAVAILVLGGLGVGYVFGHTGQLSSTPAYYGHPSTEPGGDSPYPDDASGVARLRSYRGQVTAVSSTSLTVQAEDGSSKTFVVDGNTQVRNAGSSGSIADVKTGATVSVRAGSSSNSSIASLIVVAPTAIPPSPTE